ncbi:hypothetical protein VCBJG01_3365, partial [Vibrio cholerae BJG-01]
MHWLSKAWPLFSNGGQTHTSLNL